MTAGTLVGETESAVLAAVLGLPGTVTGGGEVDQGHVTEEKDGIGLALNPRREKLSIAAGEGGHPSIGTSLLVALNTSHLCSSRRCKLLDRCRRWESRLLPLGRVQRPCPSPRPLPLRPAR